MKKLCIYHGNCADGFGAALAVRMALGSDNVEFHAGVYQDPPPDVTGRDVIIVDFSYKAPVIHQMANKARTLLILDHHKSAAEDLGGLPPPPDGLYDPDGMVSWQHECNAPAAVHALFDMERSGAVITWNYFHPGVEVPMLLQHIQDRDLWKFELEGTREIQANVFSYPYDFDTWEHLLVSDIDQLRADGVAIERKHFKDIKEFIAIAAYVDNIAGYEVPILNAPYFWSSDAGHIMGEGKPFAACYWDTPDGRVFSLRSNDDGVDVSEIAKKFGGGGHRNAAGFRLDFSELDNLSNPS